jgi:hypothetical protein
VGHLVHHRAIELHTTQQYTPPTRREQDCGPLNCRANDLCVTCVAAHGVFAYTGQLVTSAQVPNASAFRLLHAQPNSHTHPNRGADGLMPHALHNPVLRLVRLSAQLLRPRLPELHCNCSCARPADLHAGSPTDLTPYALQRYLVTVVRPLLPPSPGDEVIGRHNIGMLEAHCEINLVGH